MTDSAALRRSLGAHLALAECWLLGSVQKTEAGKLNLGLAALWLLVGHGGNLEGVFSTC